MGKAKILIIEDDRDIIEMIEYNLGEQGYDTLAALNGRDGVELVTRDKPDLIILDVMMPVMDGLEVCRTLRAKPETRDIPIIILSAKSQETDKVVGLELGADDYVTKPFSPRELIARIKAVLRRTGDSETQQCISIGDIEINSDKHKVTVRGKPIDLTHTEFKLLEFLARRPGVVLSRDRIIDAVSGQDAMVYDRTVDAHIKSLRQKLGKAKDHIETVRGAGYRFKEF